MNDIARHIIGGFGRGQGIWWLLTWTVSRILKSSREREGLGIPSSLDIYLRVIVFIYRSKDIWCLSSY